MIYKHIVEKIQTYLGYRPTKEQLNLVNKLSTFILINEQNRLFLVTGYAGTGKTTVISAMIKVMKEFDISSVLLAPTGRAAKIFGQYAEHPSFTIHKKIYRQQSLSSGNISFVLDKNFHKDTIFWVDEASMISNKSVVNSIFGTGNILNDLVYYITSGKNCKIVLIGDNAQLPPVGFDISPSLDKKYLENLFGIQIPFVNMKEIVRQEKQSGIVHNATKLRKKLFDSPNSSPQFEVDNFSDVEKITGDEILDNLTECYDKFGKNQTIIITRSNKRANIFNAGIRKEVFDFENEIESGDFLMVVKNNYSHTEFKDEFIANGEIVELVKLFNYEEMYGFKFANVQLCFHDKEGLLLNAKILLNTLVSEAPALTENENQKFMENVMKDYENIKNKKTRFEMLRKNKYFNALQVKYAYAVTCHKSQGGQWKAVFIDQGYFTKDMLDKSYYRWLYTAVTRATKKLYLLNFNSAFFV